MRRRFNFGRLLVLNNPPALSEAESCFPTAPLLLGGSTPPYLRGLTCVDMRACFVPTAVCGEGGDAVARNFSANPPTLKESASSFPSAPATRGFHSSTFHLNISPFLWDTLWVASDCVGVSWNFVEFQ